MLSEPPTRSRMLVVEDDEVMRELLLTLLDMEGHEVHVVASGGAALDWLASAPVPDMILTDMQMPGLKGLALVQALREAAAPSTHLLGMSGSRPHQTVLDGLDAFVLKPFGYADLQAAFHALQPAAPILDAGSAHGPNLAEPAFLGGATTRDWEANGMQSADTTGTTVLDEDIFASLQENFRSAQLAELYNLTLTDVQLRRGKMQSDAEAGNLDALQREAHSIKGLCGMVGARELGALAAAVEMGTTPDLGAIREISAACARLRRMLDTKFDTYPAPAGEHE